MLWRERNGGRSLDLYASTHMSDGSSDVEPCDRTLYAMVATLFDGNFRASYWKLVRIEGSEDPMMDGDWEDFPDVGTKEEARLLAENAVRINLGGWP